MEIVLPKEDLLSKMIIGRSNHRKYGERIYCYQRQNNHRKDEEWKYFYQMKIFLVKQSSKRSRKTICLLKKDLLAKRIIEQWKMQNAIIESMEKAYIFTKR